MKRSSGRHQARRIAGTRLRITRAGLALRGRLARAPARRPSFPWAHALALAVPAFLAALVAMATVHTQFFVDGPLLQDAGQYAFVSWRGGAVPKNPFAGFPVETYYGLHLAPLIGLASLVSALAPLDRVDWLVALTGLAWLPVGVAVASVVPRRLRGARALLAGLAGLAFALDGQALVCLTFPHHEIVIAGGLCLLVAGLARPSAPLAWLGVALALGAREDGGLHAATFLAASMLLTWSGRPFPLPGRTQRRILLAAVGGSALAFAVQHACFVTAPLFREEYLGVPAFAHLTARSLRGRLTDVVTDAGFVVLPLVGTAGIALVRRDARYLLGWLAALPWLALNVLAAQDLKARLQLYTAFPCIASVLWVAAYGARDRQPPWLVAIPSLLATAGLALSSPGALPYVWAHAWSLGRADRAAVHDFVGRLARAAGPTPYVDQAIASWIPERCTPRDLVVDEAQAPDGHHDRFVFFRTDAFWNGSALGWLSRSPFSRCGRVPGTEIFECHGEAAAPLAGVVPSAPFLRASVLEPARARRDGESVLVAGAPTPELAVFGPFVRLARGRYRARWEPRGEGPGRPPRVDVFQAGRVLAEAELTAATTDLVFAVEGSAPIELRLFAGDHLAVIDGVRVELAP